MMKLTKVLLEHDADNSEVLLKGYESLSDGNRFTYPDGDKELLATVYVNVLNWTYNLTEYDSTSDAYSEISEVLEEAIAKMSEPCKIATRKMLFDD